MRRYGVSAVAKEETQRGKRYFNTEAENLIDIRHRPQKCRGEKGGQCDTRRKRESKRGRRERQKQAWRGRGNQNPQAKKLGETATTRRTQRVK